MVLNVDKLLQIVGKIHTSLSDTSKIKSKSISIRCPENKGICSVGFEIKAGLRRSICSKITVPVPNLTDVQLTGYPYLSQENKAIVISNDKFDIIFKHLSKHTETFIAEVEFTLPDGGYLDNLVQRSSQTESMTDSKDEYWMDAQLKNVEILKTEYGNVSLRDMDFYVDVGVQEDVKTQLPSSFLDDIKIVDAWLSESDRVKKYNYSMEHLRQSKKTKYAGEEKNLLRNLNELFASSRFESFVDVQHPFHYSKCEKVNDFMDLSQLMSF